MVLALSQAFSKRCIVAFTFPFTTAFLHNPTIVSWINSTNITPKSRQLLQATPNQSLKHNKVLAFTMI